MNRLQSEWRRLFGPLAAAGDASWSEDTPLIDDQGQTRALVLALNGPADWDLLSTVWRSVQVEMDLPAPAIAVAGADGFQLWFSLAEPVPATRALAFLDALRQRYLGDVKPSRVGLLPAVACLSPLQVVHARPVPAELPDGNHWSAFVAPDLAPVFGDEPWLDSAPNPVGQSDLLSRIKSIPAADFLRLLEPPRPAPEALDLEPATVRAAAASIGAEAGAGAGPAVDRLTSAGAGASPRRFLLEVMNDTSVSLGLRIDAAKALLPYVDEAEQR